MKGLAAVLAVTLLSFFPDSALAGDNYIRFGEGYLVSFSNNRLAIGNAAGVNVTAGHRLSSRLALEADYLDYKNGPSAGFASLNFSRQRRSLRPHLNLGFGAIDHQLLGVGAAGKAGIGLDYVFHPSFSPELALGFQTSVIKGVGNVGGVLYLNNALMLAVHF